MSTAISLEQSVNPDTTLGQPHPPHQQHGQLGPFPPYAPTTAGQRDCHRPEPEPADDGPEPDHAVRTARDHQQIDLAMLRLAFRNILTENGSGDEDERSRESPIRDVSCSELNQLVSAVVRLHSSERELLGIHAGDHEPNGSDPYDYLEHLSTRELLSLCYQEGITPPPSLQADAETSDPDPTGQT